MRGFGWLVVVAGLGLVSGCVAGGGETTCPRDYREVAECPEDKECKRIEGDGETLICERLTCDTDPECPIESDRVDECYRGERCFLRERCGDAVMCREQDRSDCDRSPECPERSEQVSTCPEDALCFEVRRCGESITCEDETAY